MRKALCLLLALTLLAGFAPRAAAAAAEAGGPSEEAVETAVSAAAVEVHAPSAIFTCMFCEASLPKLLYLDDLLTLVKSS